MKKEKTFKKKKIKKEMALCLEGFFTEFREHSAGFDGQEKMFRTDEWAEKRKRKNAILIVLP